MFPGLPHSHSLILHSWWYTKSKKTVLSLLCFRVIVNGRVNWRRPGNNSANYTCPPFSYTSQRTTVRWVHEHCSSQRCIATVQPAEVTTWVGETLCKVLHMSNAGVFSVQPVNVTQTPSQESCYRASHISVHMWWFERTFQSTEGIGVASLWKTKCNGYVM